MGRQPQWRTDVRNIAMTPNEITFGRVRRVAQATVALGVTVLAASAGLAYAADREDTVQFTGTAAAQGVRMQITIPGATQRRSASGSSQMWRPRTPAFHQFEPTAIRPGDCSRTSIRDTEEDRRPLAPKYGDARNLDVAAGDWGSRWLYIRGPLE